MRSFSLILLLMSVIRLYGQAVAPAYRMPVDLPLHLSGTFAEFRADHFHSGIDIRTGGVEGHPVYAIADGYVSRVVVSPVGFGKAVYIDHPATGHASVYAHLQRFAPPINKYVRDEQYRQERFAVNLNPEANLLPVKKGMIIGYSGNSGSSGGPHLHFEIRDAATQHILNPMAFGFAMVDTQAPIITRMAVYPEAVNALVQGKGKAFVLNPVQVKGVYVLPEDRPVRAGGPISFGLGAYDQSQGSTGRNGVYSMELFIDSLQFFTFRADRFSFDDTRFVNSLTDYGFNFRHKSRIIRTKRDPYNRLRFLATYHRQDGVFVPEPGRTYSLRWTVADFAGNKAELRFSLIGEEPSAVALTDSTAGGPLLKAGRQHVINGQGFTAVIPDNALYRDENISASVSASKNYLSDRLNLGHGGIPLHVAASIAIEPYKTTIPNDKLLIVRIEEGKDPTPLQSSFENGRVKASSRVLGTFAVMADTLAPRLKPLNFTSGRLPDTLKTLRIEVKDDLSGIASIRPTLNDRWILMGHDPKNNLLVYELDDRMRKGSNTLRVVVTDNAGNSRTLKLQLEKP
ncbi:MAG TPA: M23 family metallopeptidase [Bacteroidales bacterium]|nr:M23 family metallopeptidase [Bacteroidales bacterium]